jgi:hypothetical protein
MFKTGKLEIGTSAQIKFNEGPKKVKNYTDIYNEKTGYSIDHALKSLKNPNDVLSFIENPNVSSFIENSMDVLKFPIDKYKYKN